jgi:hypothetical protein
MVLNRMSKRDLARMCADGIVGPDGSRTVIEGAYPVEQWLREEIVASILKVEFPSEVTR